VSLHRTWTCLSEAHWLQLIVGHWWGVFLIFVESIFPRILNRIVISILMLVNILFPLIFGKTDAALFGHWLLGSDSLISKPQIVLTFDLVRIPWIISWLITSVKVNEELIVLRVTAVFFGQHFNFIFFVIYFEWSIHIVLLLTNIKQIRINHIKSYILLFHSSVSYLD